MNKRTKNPIEGTSCTDEVDDEAAVGVAARRMAKERHAVRWRRCRVDERALGEDWDVVAGVCKGVAEAKDGVIARVGGDGLRQGRDEENQEDAQGVHRGTSRLTYKGPGRGMKTTRFVLDNDEMKTTARSS